MLTTRSAAVRAILEMSREKSELQKFYDSTWKGGAFGNKRPIGEVLYTGAWKGRRCFIIAGGPSLQGFNFKQLENEFTIGINRAYESFDCNIMFCMDGRFFKWIHEKRFGAAVLERFRAFQGLKLWLEITNHRNRDTFYLRSAGRKGLTHHLEDGLFAGQNAGYSALNLAYVLGANPIYLLGYDMKMKGERGHYHTGYPIKFTQSSMNSFKFAFKYAAPILKGKGVKVINCNPDSGLTYFDFKNKKGKGIYLPPDVGKNRRPIYVTYYTNNKYKNLAYQLTDDFYTFTLRHHVEKVVDTGSWVKNCQEKPKFIRRMMDLYPGNPIVWVDADARIRRDPSLFDNIKCDFACHFRSRNYNMQFYPHRELLSGTLYFVNNKKSRDLIDLWIEENRRDPKAFDQRTLQKVVKPIKKNPKLKGGNSKWDGVMVNLPAPYCLIFDTMKQEGPAVIEHFQASRTERRL